MHLFAAENVFKIENFNTNGSTSSITPHPCYPGTRWGRIRRCQVGGRWEGQPRPCRDLGVPRPPAAGAPSRPRPSARRPALSSIVNESSAGTGTRPALAPLARCAAAAARARGPSSLGPQPLHPRAASGRRSRGRAVGALRRRRSVGPARSPGPGRDLAHPPLAARAATGHLCASWKLRFPIRGARGSGVIRGFRNRVIYFCEKEAFSRVLC